MTEAEVRELGVVQAERPQAEPVPHARPADEPPAQRSMAPTPLDLLAELVAHAGTRAPCTIGLLGGPGSGKSFTLTRLLSQVGEISAAAGRADGPFLSRVTAVRIEASSLEGEATTALAAALHHELAVAAPDLAREAAHAVQDPQTVARDAAERHDAAQRRLETERRGLDELDGRRARLTETILYETPGSQVDSYARANRARIENALVRFGIGGDPIRSYKDLVRALAEAGGAGGRASLAARAFWSFKGQFKLLMTALVLIVVGIGLGLVIEDRATWLTSLRGTSDSMLPVATWMETHVSWLGVMQKIAFAGAGLAILANLWRGLRFLQPVFRGYSLLGGDLTTRRRDLDAGFAHQTRRVDGLSAEVDATAKHAADAERRAGSAGAQTRPSEPAPFEAASSWIKARDYVAAADRHIEAGQAGAALPERIVVAIDDLESVSAARAREILDASHRLIAVGRNMIVVLALDPRAVCDGDGARRALDKWVSLPFHVPADHAAGRHDAFVRTAFGQPVPRATTRPVDPKASALDRPIADDEIALVAALGRIADRSPRALKRFVDVYRIARLSEGAQPAPLALMLALDAGGTPDEIAALQAALARTNEAGGLDIASLGPRLRQVIAGVPGFGAPISKRDAVRNAAIAEAFSLHA